MGVTIKEIAEICKVSRGTVDRVLNNRGRVSAETAALVLKTAQELSYTPNPAGKALAAKRKKLNIYVAAVSSKNPFYDEVFDGIREAEEQLKAYGVRIVIKTLADYSAEEQIQTLEEIRADADAVILTPVNLPSVAEKINEISDSGIAVFTLNSDIENSKRICYIGSNYINGGQTACGMMGLTAGPSAKIGVITGSVDMLCHAERIRGFNETMREKFPLMKVVDIDECRDSDTKAYYVTKKMLEAHEEINALYITAGGVYGAVRAVMDCGRNLNIICFDAVPKTAELIKAGKIKCAICQEPYEQGMKSVMTAFDCIAKGILPPEEKLYVKTEIKIAENL